MTKFFMDSGVGGVVSEPGAGVRQRMVFPGEISIIQTLEPKMVLLNTNQSEEIRIGVIIQFTNNSIRFNQ